MATAQDPLLGTLTRTTNFNPLYGSISQAKQARLAGNQAGLSAAQGGLTQQAQELRAGSAAARDTRDPFMQTGQHALSQAFGLSGGFTPESLSAALQNDPVLKSIIDQGVRASNQSASATGQRFSAGQQLELQRLGQAEASKYINDQFNRQMQLANLGGQFASDQAREQFGLGASLGDVAANRGQVGADAALAAGDISAQAALDTGRAQVAQSTVSGLKDGQIGGLAGREIPVANPNVNPDPWGNAATMGQAVGGDPSTPFTPRPSVASGQQGFGLSGGGVSNAPSSNFSTPSGLQEQTDIVAQAARTAGRGIDTNKLTQALELAPQATGRQQSNLNTWTSQVEKIQSRPPQRQSYSSQSQFESAYRRWKGTLDTALRSLEKAMDDIVGSSSSGAGSAIGSALAGTASAARATGQALGAQLRQSSTPAPPMGSATALNYGLGA